MAERQQFPYLSIPNAQGTRGLRPFVPITLSYNQHKRQTLGLLDSGADVNVLPHELGLELGGIWEKQQIVMQLSGNLANLEARGIIIEAAVANMPAAKLAFAWTRAEGIPLILGQVNFFMAFDVCFFRSRNLFEIEPKSADLGANEGQA